MAPERAGSEKDLSWLGGLNYDRVLMIEFRAMRILTAFLLVSASGCAAQSDKHEKELRELTERIQRLQSTTDRLEERMLAIEHQRGRPSQTPTTKAASPAIPDLPVVKMAPDVRNSPAEPPASGDESNEPRPLLVGEGSRIETRNGGETAAPTPTSPTKRSKEKASGGAPAKRPSENTDPGKKAP